MTALVIFLVTYLGVGLGRIPGMAIDRTGIALLGAIAMVLWGILPPDQALAAINIPTLLVLYGLMIVSAQLRLGGFYTWLALRVARWIDRPRRFLLLLMVISGALASVLANDIICFAFTPVLAVALKKKQLNPVPFLLGLAMATNLGSAATIIGNPQSILIGQLGNLSFARFFNWCAPPSLFALLATYGIILGLYRQRLYSGATAALSASDDAGWPRFNVWQTIKGIVATVVIVIFLLADYPRAMTIVMVAGFLLLSRHMHTRAMLELIDWHLITLFCGLFIVVRGLNVSGIPESFVAGLQQIGVSLGNPYALSIVSVTLSNMVSNVPATTLMSPYIPAAATVSWYVLSLATTYAGNLLPIGSMANLIVIERARHYGIAISFKEYAATGIVVTTANILILMIWIWWRAAAG